MAHKGTGEKILKHPKKDEIIQKLMNGQSPKSIEAWLKGVYGEEQKIYHVSWLTLQQFRKHFLNMEKDAILALSKEQQQQQDVMALADLQQEIKESEAYKQRVAEIQTQVLDNTEVLDKAYRLCLERIDTLSSRELSYQDDKNLVGYISQIRQLFLAQQDFLGKVKDARAELNINIGAVQTQLVDTMVVVREILQEMAPELIPRFLSKFKAKMDEQPQTSQVSQTSISASLNTLKKTVDVVISQGQVSIPSEKMVEAEAVVSSDKVEEKDAQVILS